MGRRYKSVSRNVLADRHFPVRVRIAVPPNGFGSQLNQIHGWLNEHVGKSAYWEGGGSSVLGAESVFFYFLTVTAAAAFLNKFPCQLSTVGEWPESRDMRGGGPAPGTSG